MAKTDEVTFNCPVCGSEVRVGAAGCRDCGSNAETGWSPDTEYDGLDLPDADEDLEAEAPPRRPRWVLIVLIAATVATLLVSMW